MERADQDDNIWLERAKNAYSMSQTYMDSNYRKVWENAERAWQSKHPLGSKYNRASFKYRSRLFRPKTRSMCRQNEAAASSAFFGNIDLVSIEPQDPNNRQQQASADLNRSLLEFRFQNTIPWFVIVMGATQETQKTGVVYSYQDWEYLEKEEEYEIEYVDPISDKTEKRTRTETITVKDQPRIRLLPPENVLFHPNAEWYDPINLSPFLTILWPMYIMDVEARMEKEDAKTNRPRWQKLNKSELQSAQKARFDSTRLTRQNQMQDTTDEKVPGVKDFDIIWVHENYIRIGGDDWVYYTLGTEYMLDKEPIPIEDVHFHGERPIAMGCGAIEVFRAMPNSLTTIALPVQKEINQIANERRDNVSLVLNKRYKVKRGSQVDLRSIVRNVPASITMVDEHTDVDTIDFNDVTGSSYAEQDRMNAEYDSLVGGFDAGSVMMNRQMNETVGGMRMIKSGSMSLTDYFLKTLAETWMEKVVKQIIKLEQYYETDDVVLAIAGAKAQLAHKYNVDRITDDLLNQSLFITVSAGDGSSDPEMKLRKFLYAIKEYVAAVAQMAKMQTPALEISEVGKEIFARLGYKGGERFIYQQDKPENQLLVGQIQKLEQALQQMQAQLEDKEADRQLKLADRQMQEEGDTERVMIKEEGENRRLIMELQAELNKLSMQMANYQPGPQFGGTGRNLSVIR